MPARITGIVSVAISRIIGTVYLGQILKALSLQFPHLKVHFCFGTTGEIIEKLINNYVDIGITIGHQKMATLVQKKIQQGKYVLIQSNQKPKLKFLTQENFILTEPRHETEILKKQFYKKYKQQLQVQNEVGSWDVITELVSGGIGVGLVPDLILNSDKKTKVTAIKTDWFNCPYEVYLNRSKSSQKIDAIYAVTDVIESQIQNL